MPSLVKCPSCGRVTPEEDLAGCTTCAARFCNHPACDWHCVCDDIAPDRKSDSRFGAALRGALLKDGMTLDDLIGRLGL